MNQMDLFEDRKRPPSGRETRPCPIRSGRVGPIRFGATDDSFAMTREVLTDLAIPPDDAAETPS